MTNRSASAVVRIDRHPAFQASERRSREFEEAMRRHPCFQSRATPLVPQPAPPLRLA
ncbi:hypothetical protein ACNUDN_06845 [Mycobacterium sp. smrl_JER01]|uniref:hypothetical protein n=1 Tax=Mycobacterium sp. smrl_JER01 TaxID=3402633 RepID=UPI003AD48514